MRALNEMISQVDRAEEVTAPSFVAETTDLVVPAPDLRSCRIIWESADSPRGFEGRGIANRGEFTHERARQAFEDYKYYRDLADRRVRRAELDRELTTCRMLGRSHDAKEVERRIRENEYVYNPQGGEIALQCTSFEEARLRVMELIGPVDSTERHYRYARFGDYRKTHYNNDSGPVNGFEASVHFGSNGKAQKFSRSWRIDYDPIKGTHFNVIIRPGGILTEGYLHHGDSESLKLALVFPGDQQSYERHLQDIELSAISSVANDGVSDTSGHRLDYLSKNE